MPLGRRHRDPTRADPPGPALRTVGAVRPSDRAHHRDASGECHRTGHCGSPEHRGLETTQEAGLQRADDPAPAAASRARHAASDLVRECSPGQRRRDDNPGARHAARPIARPSTAGCAEANSRAAWQRSAPSASGSSPPLRPQHEPAIESRYDNTIEKAFSKLKALLRKAAERTVSGLHQAILRILAAFTASECANYFASASYDLI